MSSIEIDHVTQVWPDVAPWLPVPHDDDEYQRLVAMPRSSVALRKFSA